ncbi:LLM class flavin-dependent oxidoreductase [Nocardia salmonicida]
MEAVAGRGSSTITFDLFDYDESDYDLLFSSKLDLLLAVNTATNIDFAGPHRRKPLRETTVYPRPARPLPIWLGTGGSPNSVIRAAELGVPMFIGILGGTPEHWARYGHAYRNAWTQTGRPADRSRIAVAVHGFIGPDNAEAKATYLRHELAMFATGAAEAGRPPMTPTGREHDLQPGGMVFAGNPDEIADRIIHLHQLLRHDRQILQMDVGGMPQTELLRSIELLGTEVAPRVRKALS